jgi:DNA excision repair protein ERCC-3
MSLEQLKEVQPKLKEAEEAILKARDELAAKQRTITDLITALEKSQGIQVDEKLLKTWAEKPYSLRPRKADRSEWWLSVPRWHPLTVGWLEDQDDTYNHFVITRQTQWFTKVPEEIAKEMDLNPVFDGMNIQGDLLTVERDDLQKVIHRYRQHIQKQIGDRQLKVKAGHQFPLIASLIRDGILPFTPIPVDQGDLRDLQPQFTLRDYQEAAYKRFLETGALGIYWAMGAGKTNFGLWTLTHIKGPKLIIVPTRTLVEQWVDRITTLCPPETKEEVEILTYQGAQRILAKEYTLVIFDECHRLPANTFSQLAMIRTKYRIGLSATPWREDGRSELIFALTGFPMGLDWRILFERKLISKPSITVIIEKNDPAKDWKLLELLKIQGLQTIVFCDSLSKGSAIAQRLNRKGLYRVPFVSGQTKAGEVLKTISKALEAPSHIAIVSRVGDEGISLKNLRRIIEYDFLFGSRRQEMQRLGRLLHSEWRGQHIVLMTTDEYAQYRKRLLGAYEKGFKIDYQLGEGVPEDFMVSPSLPEPTPTRFPAPRREKAPLPPRLDTPWMKEEFEAMKRHAEKVSVVERVPSILLDERETYGNQLILKVLQEAKGKGLPGLTVGQIDEVLENNHIKGVPARGCRDAVKILFEGKKINGRTREDGKRLYFI